MLETQVHGAGIHYMYMTPSKLISEMRIYSPTYSLCIYLRFSNLSTYWFGDQGQVTVSSLVLASHKQHGDSGRPART